MGIEKESKNLQTPRMTEQELEQDRNSHYDLQSLNKIPLPVQGEGKRAWRARVRAVATYDVGRLVDDHQAAQLRIRVSSPSRKAGAGKGGRHGFERVATGTR